MKKDKRKKKKEQRNNQPVLKQNKRVRKRTLQKEKDRRQRVEEMSSQLAEAKEQLFRLYEMAWDRLEKIEASGYSSYSADEFSKKSIDAYTLANINSRDEVLKQFYNVRAFLNDKGSTVEGAQLETIQLSASQYKGMFGNQYNTEEYDYKKYNTKFIDKRAAEKAFEAYRNLKSSRAVDIVFHGGYGSENLIIAIYDAVIRGLDGQMYGEDVLNVFKKQDKQYWDKTRENIDEAEAISGILQDNITRWNW